MAVLYSGSPNLTTNTYYIPVITAGIVASVSLSLFHLNVHRTSSRTLTFLSFFFTKNSLGRSTYPSKFCPWFYLTSLTADNLLSESSYFLLSMC
jgi:hypothetical protein